MWRMRVEAWGTMHPVELAVLFAFICTLLLSPFSGDIRRLYSALLRGVHMVLRTYHLNQLRQLGKYIADPFYFLRHVVDGISFSGLIVSMESVVVVVSEHKSFKRLHPSSDIDLVRIHEYTKVIAFLMAMILAWILCSSVFTLRTVWTLRSPRKRAHSLRVRLAPLSESESAFLDKSLDI